MWILIIHISLSHVRAINNHLLEGLGPHVAMTAIGNPLLKWRCYVSKWSINGWISSKPPLITGWKICIWYAYYVVSQAPLIMIPDAYFRHLRIRLQGVIQKHHVLKPLTYTDQPEMLPNFSPSHGQPRDTPDLIPHAWQNIPKFNPCSRISGQLCRKLPLSPILHLSFTYLSLVARYKHTSYDLS